VKIPCVVVVFHDADTVKTSLDSLVRLSDRLDIHVLENPSENTEDCIRPYVEGLLAEGLVSQYVLFDENISNNAVEVFFDDGLLPADGYDHILLTDGDLLPLDDSWLDEELAILGGDRAVFACGIALDASNLPLQVFPESKDWIAAPKSETDLYIEAPTGIQLVLMKADDFWKYWKYRRAKELKFIDSVIHKYCREKLRRKWVRTKKSRAVHLTWNLYADPDHPYTKMKQGLTLAEQWAHDRYCGYEVMGGIPADLPREGAL